MSNLTPVIKSIQDIMRQDSGVDGDAQRISQLTWLLFLKVFDALEEELELTRDHYQSPIPEAMRWRHWAADPELMNPYRFEPAISPHFAARDAGVEISLARLVEHYQSLARQADIVLVEGAGGWLAPLSDRLDIADLAVALDLPVMLVVGMRLGCINQALLTLEAIEARGLTVIGWVANTLEVEMRFIDENIDALIERIPAPLLGKVPRMAQPGAEEAASYLDFTGLPNWPMQHPDN